jgi:uncharacterized protein YsxB (DUF464 family)
MTKAVISRLKDGSINGFSIKGHAGAAKSGEYDMVCAAISAVCYTALGGLEELCGVNTYKELDGDLSMALPESLTGENYAKAQVILKTMEIGLKQIENQYHRYIQVSFKEV